jgi:thioredoxin-like negative regulator of GroEL
MKEEPVSFLRKLFGREEPEDVPVNLNVERRKEQLHRLERALDALAAEMRADHTTNDPAWRERVNEYSDPGERAGSGLRGPSVVHWADS